jgi:prepilin-type processing-associated H-X9-DG protein
MNTNQAIGQGRRRVGFTLVETLVVIAILGTLVGLLLPAVYKVRESAGRISCQNNLRQIALAAGNYQSVNGYFPSGGWGWAWVGVPERGNGRQQPGGWVFSLLPYLDQQPLYDSLKGANDTQRQEATHLLVATPVHVMNCPTRRSGGPYPNPSGLDYRGAFAGTVQPDSMARGDYAANAGSQVTNELNGGPISLAEGDTVFPWYNVLQFNGVTYQRSETRLIDIPKGLSNVFFVGEKYINPAHYETGLDPGDNESMFIGFGNDVNRVTFEPPTRDRRNFTNSRIFGSSHPSGFNMAMCDGSVRAIEYSIDPVIFREGGDRR